MSWELEPWQAVETLEPVSSKPQVIDVHWKPVESLESCDEVQWLEPDTDSYPVVHEVNGGELERHVNAHIVTDDDMATANDWLARVDAMQQLATTTQTNTQPQTLTALWQRITNPVKTTSKHQAPRGPQQQTDTAASDHGPRWYFVCERDSSEPESLQHLRYWYMQYSYAEGVTEWSEAAFMEWAEGLTDDELATFAAAGEQIALGNWQDHVNEPTADTIEKTRASDGRGPVEYVVDAFMGLL